MRSALISTPFVSVPPVTYGGTELVVHELAEGLIERGHEVTLFASGDSVTAAKLVACSERSLRLDERVVDHEQPPEHGEAEGHVVVVRPEAIEG